MHLPMTPCTLCFPCLRWSKRRASDFKATSNHSPEITVEKNGNLNLYWRASSTGRLRPPFGPPKESSPIVVASIERPPNAWYTEFGFMKENTVRARSDVSSNDYANTWRTAIKQSTALSGHLPVPRERAINGGSTVEVSPDFASCVTVIRNFSKPCLTKNVVLKWKGTYWRILCGNNSERLIWHWNLAMHAGRLVSCIFTSRHRSELLNKDENGEIKRT